VIKLIVGLGNPGQQYQKTRHNAGFLFLDYLAGVSAWSSEAKFHGTVASSLVGGNKVILLKPQTFMNKSGLSVSSIARYFKIELEEILVAHDELDLSSGVVRLKKGGGHAGHNGLRDIIASLGGKDFYRLRLGIGRPNPGKNVADFVLSDLSKQGWSELCVAFESVDAYLGRIVLGEMDVVMNGLNKK
jgi:PTH1 family peptidyl-tRNA hydrolase